MEEVFYKHYLEREKERRKEAIEFLKKRDFKKLRNNYVHYLKSEHKVVELGEEISLNKCIEKLIEIKNSLPKNSDYAVIESRIEYGEGGFGGQDESKVVVSWREYSIENEKKCEGLAKCWARGSNWKMNHQPNGKDGKRAKELYDKLIVK